MIWKWILILKRINILFLESDKIYCFMFQEGKPKKTILILNLNGFSSIFGGGALH